MSSTNRGSERNKEDYYYTPIQTIQDFWKKFCEVENLAYRHFNFVLDPCAGGDNERPCAYPEALKMFEFNFTHEFNFVKKTTFLTFDIRADSKAEFKCDYLLLNEDFHIRPELIISNPPFKLFEDFIIKSFNIIKSEGYIIFLLRLNATGGQDRRIRFWNKYKPKAIYVHSKRPCFMKGSSDSCEYGHFVFQCGFTGDTKFYWV